MEGTSTGGGEDHMHQTERRPLLKIRKMEDETTKYYEI